MPCNDGTIRAAQASWDICKSLLPLRKVAIICVDRANWGRLQCVAEVIRAHPALSLHVICGGSSVLDRFACPADDIEQAGYSVSRVWHEVEGNSPLTMAMSLGHGCAEYAVELQRCKPDAVMLIGDRYEALGAACAAATMRIPIVHLQGGEVSGAWTSGIDTH